MKCPYCVTVINPQWNTGRIDPSWSGNLRPEHFGHPMADIEIETAWIWKAAECPACDKTIIFVELVDVQEPIEPLVQHLAHPQFARRKIVGDAVPETLKADYFEACNVLSVSPIASAVLSRRILEAILRRQGYVEGSLGNKIVAVLCETSPDKILPTSVRPKIDALRGCFQRICHEGFNRRSIR